MQLVIAEKPSVAKSIADVLGAIDRQDGYFEGGGYIVSWCVGHLIELAEPESYGDQWKKWTYESLPVNPDHWQYEIKEDTKEQYDVQFKFVMKFPNKKFTGKKKQKKDERMGSERTKKVQDNESKADKFVRLGEYRVNKVIDAIGRLENLFNRTNYEYTQEQVEVMFSIMEKRLLEVKGRFAPKKEKEDTFSFGRKAE